MLSNTFHSYKQGDVTAFSSIADTVRYSVTTVINSVFKFGAKNNLNLIDIISPSLKLRKWN